LHPRASYLRPFPQFADVTISALRSRKRFSCAGIATGNDPYHVRNREVATVEVPSISSCRRDRDACSGHPKC